MNKPTRPPRLTAIVTSVYDLLEPLEATDRTKILQSVLGLLGDTSTPLVATTTTIPPGNGGSAGAHGQIKGIKASQWMKKHGITGKQLEHIFHLDGQFDVIATPPGKNKREQTINAYLLVGLQHLLQSDDTKFTESDAVSLCKQTGCHDSPNHALTRSKFGNRIAGSKESYSLTTPGLDQVATLVKALGTTTS